MDRGTWGGAPPGRKAGWGQVRLQAEPQSHGGSLGWGGGVGAGTGLEWGGMCPRDAARAKGNHPNNSSETMSVPAQEKHSGREEAAGGREAAARGGRWWEATWTSEAEPGQPMRPASREDGLLAPERGVSAAGSQRPAAQVGLTTCNPRGTSDNQSVWELPAPSAVPSPGGFWGVLHRRGGRQQ